MNERFIGSGSKCLVCPDVSSEPGAQATGPLATAPRLPLGFGLARRPCPKIRSALDKCHTAQSFCLLVFGAVAAALVLSACVRRTMTITTEPPNARVFLNDQEVGRSEVTTDFLWYGDYDVVIRKDGFETLKTHWNVDPPWYEHIPLDFFSEVLWPWQVHDRHSQHFVLVEAKTPSTEEVIQRADELRQKVTEPEP